RFKLSRVNCHRKKMISAKMKTLMFTEYNYDGSDAFMVGNCIAKFMICSHNSNRISAICMVWPRWKVITLNVSQWHPPTIRPVI
ncbi:MAG: hypothetical protein K8S18_21690, partial [Desulfobacula sp.]|nr:hypothetical protein [Desulfobacula sp.]